MSEYFYSFEICCVHCYYDVFCPALPAFLLAARDEENQ